MEPVEIEAKTLIQKSKTPSNEYVINPYTGCVLGCAYCFASFAGRQFGRSVKEWGEYLYVKKNETKYRLTRGILRELKAVEYPGLVRILTKSPVVTRDIDLLAGLPRAEVGMTVTTTDDKVSRWLEVRAPIASRRLRALAELKETGIPTYAFVGPLLPHFATQPELLDDLFGQLVDAGATEVFMEHINLKRYIRERMNEVLDGEPEGVRLAYVQARTKEHREQLDGIVVELLDKHGLRLRFEEVVHHDDNDALRERLARSA